MKEFAMNHKKPSFTMLFTIICLSILIVSILTLSVVSFLHLRSISYAQISLATKENTANMSNQVGAMVTSHVALLENTVVGSIFFMQEPVVDRDALSLFFDDMQATLENVLMIYCTNNLRWNSPGGYCASSTGWFPNETWNNLERSWYQDAKKAQGKVAFTLPYIDAATGKLIIAMARTVFDKDGRDLGVVSENVSIATLGSFLSKYNVLPQQESFLITQDGMFITNPDESMVMQKDFFSELELEQYRSAILGTPSFFAMDNEHFIASSFISESNWYLVSVIPVAAIVAETNQALFQILAIGVALLVIAALVTFICTQILIKPLRSLTDYSAVLAQGDFSGTVPEYGTAEASGLSVGFNAINEHISVLIRNIIASFGQMRTNGSQLKQVIDQSSTAASKIVEAVHDVDRRIKEESGLVGKTVTEIDDKILSLNALIQDQSAQISSSSTAIETMIAYNKDMQAQITKLTGGIQQLINSSKAEHEHIAHSTHTVQQIGEDSKNLALMTKVISNVAEETNLLAMNAAIEAAHAGTAGKGFAVVASEIRKLAETTAAQAKGVSGTLMEIQARITEITALSGRIEGAYTQTNSLVLESNTVGAQIKCTIEEQVGRSQQVLERLQQIQAITSKVNAEAENIKIEADASRHMSDQLADMSEIIQGRVSEVVRSTELVFAASQQAHESVEENGRGLDALDGAIQHFIVRN
jgi:methyl-accepting chemotaxis protein